MEVERASTVKQFCDDFLGSSLLAAVMYAAIALLIRSPALDSSNAGAIAALLVGAVFVCGVGGAVYFVVTGLVRNSLLS